MCCKQDILGGVGFSTTYGQASVNTWTVGNVMGYLHENIIRRQDSSNTETYCIGHSLGSHVCGFFGKMVKELLGQKYMLQKIVGLDPAGPIFDDPSHNTNLRLNKEDARSVETILTNTETLGFSTPLGDVDLHIHGGACQPWCKNCDTTSPGGIGLFRWTTASCHHAYAYQLMLELINRQIPCSLGEKESKSPSLPNSDTIWRDVVLIYYMGSLDNSTNIPNGEYNVETDKKLETDVIKKCSILPKNII